MGSDVAADDILQDTWLAALRRPPDPGRPLRPWLATVVRNKVFNRSRERVRRDAREACANESEGSEAAEILLGRLEIHRILVDVVSELAEPYRQAILLAYFEDLTSAEIGERVNVPASTIRGRLKTALELLREALDARLGGRSAWLPVLTDFSRLRTPPARARPGRTSASVASRGAVAGGGIVIPAAVAFVALAAAATIWTVAKRPVASQQNTASAQRAPSPAELDEPGAPSGSSGVPTPSFRRASAAPGPAPFSSSTGLGLLLAGSTIRGAVFAGEPDATPVASRLGRGGSVADAVVRIIGVRPNGTDRSVSTLTPAISQGRFLPRVLLVAPGEPLVLRNEDDSPHVARVTRRAIELFNGSISAHERATVPIPGGMEVLRLEVLDGGSRTSFAVPSDRGLGCKTDSHGMFALFGVPTGRYTLEVWDETLGTKRVEVTVPFTGPPLQIVFGSEPPQEPVRVMQGSSGCTIAIRGDGPIAKACATGGRGRAKKVMKELVKAAWSHGKKFTCDGCHKDLEGFDLTASARDDLEKMLASAQRAP